MKISFGSMIAWVAAATVCIVLLCTTAYADTNTSGFRMGPGDHYDDMGNIVSLNGSILVYSDGTIADTPGNPYGVITEGIITETPGTIFAGGLKTSNVESGVNFTVETIDGQRVYTFEGKKYIVEQYIHEFKLTGYDYKSASGNLTRSGKTATAKHTIAATSSLLGKTILVVGTTGKLAHDYDGIYVCEDTGGSRIESGERLDIWFDSYEEALRVTNTGWNQADAWILKPLN